MNKENFIAKISDIIEYDGELDENSILPDIDEWDSIALISTAAFIDSLGKKVTVDELKNVNTMKQLLELAEVNE